MPDQALVISIRGIIQLHRGIRIRADKVNNDLPTERYIFLTRSEPALPLHQKLRLSNDYNGMKQTMNLD